MIEISKAETFLYSLRSLYKSNSRQVITFSEYKLKRLNLGASIAKWIDDIG